MKKIKLGMPTGWLSKSSLFLFNSAGYNAEMNEVPAYVKIDDPNIECFLGRAYEIAKMVEKGTLDAGITSKDRIKDVAADVIEVCDFKFVRPGIWEEGKIAVVVPKRSPIKTIKDLKDKIIITRFAGLTRDFLKKKKISAKIQFSEAPDESQIGEIADAGVEFILTGNTLDVYNLKILEVICASSIVLAANKKAFKDKWKRRKIEDIAMLLDGARLSHEYSGLMFHASNDMMEGVFRVLPALKRPTVTHLRGENWFDVFTVVRRKQLRGLIPTLKKIGCRDMIEFPLRKVIS